MFCEVWLILSLLLLGGGSGFRTTPPSLPLSNSIRFVTSTPPPSTRSTKSNNAPNILPITTPLIELATTTTTTPPLTEELESSEKNSARLLTEELESSEKNSARLLVIVSAALYGTNFAEVKMLNDMMPLGASCALRFGIACLVASPFLLSQTRPNLKPRETLSIMLLGLEIGTYNSLGYLAQATGLQTTSASSSAFICSLAVVVVPILDFLFNDKKLSSTKILSCLLAVAGVAILEGGVADLNVGDLASCLMPLCFGAAFWRVEAALKRFPEDSNLITFFMLAAVGVISTSYCLVGGDNVPPPNFEEIMGWLQNPSILFSLLWTGCITTALTVYFETKALRSLDAQETTLLFSTEPIFGSLFAAVMLGEQFGVNGFVGAGAILASCLGSSGVFEKFGSIWVNMNSGRGKGKIWDSLNGGKNWKSIGGIAGGMLGVQQIEALQDALDVIDSTDVIGK